MALLQTEDKTPLEELKVKLRADELADAKLYARACDSSLDYVVAQALRRLTSDKDFERWKAEHPEFADAPKSKLKSATIGAKFPKGAAAA
jgi:hypothetical protein